MAEFAGLLHRGGRDGDTTAGATEGSTARDRRCGEYGGWVDAPSSAGYVRKYSRPGAGGQCADQVGRQAARVILWKGREETADLSTTLRSGRDDNSSWKRYLAFPNKIVISTGAQRSG